jgi:DNA-binding transcriptional LysR family regulator
MSHDALLYSYQRTGGAWTFDGPDGPTTVRPPSRFRGNHGDALAEAACAGLGVALLPDFIVGPYIAAGQLEGVLSDACRQVTPIQALFPPGRRIPAKSRLFADALALALQTAAKQW